MTCAGYEQKLPQDLENHFPDSKRKPQALRKIPILWLKKLKTDAETTVKTMTMTITMTERTRSGKKGTLKEQEGGREKKQGLKNEPSRKTKT